jgi:amino acid adenylation domain-containing protein
MKLAKATATAKQQVYVFAASYAQRSLWFLDQLAPGSSFYNLHVGLRLDSPLDVGALDRSINEIVRRHEVLRTAFKAVGDEPMQVVLPTLEVPLEVTDLRELDEAEREDKALRLANEEAARPFDLTRWPLLRTRLLKLGDQDHILLLTMHHIVCDYWSLDVFRDELSLLYDAFRNGGVSPLDELPIQYADYAEWERTWLDGPDGKACLAYWKGQLADAPMLQLPTERPRPMESSFEGADYDFEIPPSLHRALSELSQREGATLFMTALAAFQMLLHRYTGEDDVVVGTPVANRTRPEVQSLIGFFTTSLALRTSFAGNPTFRELLGRVRTTTVDALAQQQLPFERLVSELRPDRSLGDNPLFEVHFQLFSDLGDEEPYGSLGGEMLFVEATTAKFDLALDLWESPDGLWGYLEYRTQLFAHDSIVRLAEHFVRILEAVVANPDERVSELAILSEAERRQIVDDWNDTAVEHPGDRCLQQLFEAQVERTPDATALVFGSERLTYRELDDRANRLARHLRSLGVRAETIVAVYCRRSLDSVVALLGILKACGAYLPLSPDDPPKRLASILDDARPHLVLTQRQASASLPRAGLPLVEMEFERDLIDACSAARPDLEACPRSLAYVIYTSGSSGRPKGVEVEHRAVCNHLLWMQSALPMTESDRVLQKYPLSFDASIYEIFGPLLVGATLIVAEPSEHWDSSAFVQQVVEREITIVDLVPSLLEALLEDDEFVSCTSVRRVILGGQEVTPTLVKRFHDRMRAELHNVYGPTEATIGITTTPLSPADAQGRVPIGRAGDNMQVYILDRDLNLLPVGIPGELYAGGDCVARGYLGESALTAERFVPDPFSRRPGARLYRTGDLARYTADGAIEYLGRIDDQVELRGYRIEPGEVEAALREHESVRECAVVATDDDHGRPRLIAHVVPLPDPPELWPSLGEYDVYDELLYYAMTHDERRTAAYRDAIMRAVAGKVVLDLGTGADAVLARFCVDAGAQRVYAIEANTSAYRRAAALVETLGLHDRIVVVHADSRRAKLPEPVDVCVSEIIGSVASSEGVISVLNDARRFLKPAGTMIPRRAATMIAPVALPENLTASLRLAELPATYVQRVFESIGRPFDLRMCIKNLRREDVLADVGVFEELDFATVVPEHSERRVTFSINRDARLHGFLLWLNLRPADDQLLDSLDEPLSWLPVFFPALYPGVEVRAGDVVEVTCRRSVRDGSALPDFAVEAIVTTGDGKRYAFSHDSPARPAAFRGNAFHDALFAAMEDGAQEPAEGGTPPDPPKPLPEELRRHLEERLPSYMVPSSFAIRETLPRTSNGKLDRRALAREAHAARGACRAYVAPIGETEELCAAAWREVLQVERVGADDNFFDLGGDSLLMTQVRSRLQRDFARQLSIIELFRYPTVRALAHYLDEQEAKTAAVLDLLESLSDEAAAALLAEDER